MPYETDDTSEMPAGSGAASATPDDERSDKVESPNGHSEPTPASPAAVPAESKVEPAASGREPNDAGHAKTDQDGTTDQVSNVGEDNKAGLSSSDGDGSRDDGDRDGPSRLFWVGLVAGLVAVYLLVTFVDVWLTSRLEYESPVDVEGQRAAVVLGAAQYNGEPSPVLRGRLDEAATLYETGEVDFIVVTGGGQEADVTTEAKTGYDYLRETSGIPDERLLLEVQGASTYESLAATARFLTPDGVTDVVLVTDRYHAKRSILTAEEVGLRPVVSLTPQDPSFERLVEESFGVALGRVIGFRRLDRL